MKIKSPPIKKFDCPRKTCSSFPARVEGCARCAESPFKVAQGSARIGKVPQGWKKITQTEGCAQAQPSASIPQAPTSSLDLACPVKCPLFRYLRGVHPLCRQTLVDPLCRSTSSNFSSQPGNPRLSPIDSDTPSTTRIKHFAYPFNRPFNQLQLA